MSVAWTEEILGRALRVLGRHATVRAACDELGVSPFNLCHAFGRNGFGPPRDYLKGRTAPDPRLAREVPAPQSERKDSPCVTACADPPERSLIDAARTPAQLIEQTVAERQAKRLKAEHGSLIEELREAQARVRFADAIAEQAVIPRLYPREILSGLREGTGVALASDWHVEERVDPASVAGRNEYNLQIAEHRGRRFFESIKWMLEFERQAFTLRDLVLWIGGDIITGYIHEELEESNELAPVEAVLFAEQLLADGITSLLEDTKLERIVVPCSYGNHGRTTKKRRIKTGAQNSYEWLMYQVLARLFRDEPRVQFVVGASAHQYLEVYDKTLHFHHGDDVQYHGGVGGITIPLNKRVAQWNGVRRADYHHIGHFHQYTDLGHAVVNGSLIGYSDYAMSIGAQYEEPKQMYYVLDAKRGKCLPTPLWVDDEQAARVAA